MKLSAIAILFFVLSETAHGCMNSPLAGVAENAAHHMNENDFVFVGRVVAYEPLQVSDEFLSTIREEADEEAVEFFLRRASALKAVKFSVEYVWKGPVSQSFVALNDTSHSCSFSLDEGREYVVFGSRTDLGSVISTVVLRADIAVAREKLDRELRANDT